MALAKHAWGEVSHRIGHARRRMSMSARRSVRAITWPTDALALLLATSQHAIAQSADLRIEMLAAPTSGLAIGSEVLVTTTVANAGPDAAVGVSVDVAGVPLQPFPFDIVGSETEGCMVEPLDIDPVRFNYHWHVGSIDAQTERACTVRLRVRAMPAPVVPLSGSVHSGTPDSNPDDNVASRNFVFGGADRPRIVPSLSWHGTLLLASLMWIVLRLKSCMKPRTT